MLDFEETIYPYIRILAEALAELLAVTRVPHGEEKYPVKYHTAVAKAYAALGECQKSDNPNIRELLPPIRVRNFNLSKEWCERHALDEGEHTIGAGLSQSPFFKEE